MRTSLKEYIPVILRRWWAVTFGGVGAVGTIAQLLGYSIPHMPLWAWLLIIFIVLCIAQFLAFHKVRKQRDSLRQNQISNQIDLKEQLRSLVEEGRGLRILSVTQGEPPPEAMTENWKVKVKSFLHDNFDAFYERKWFGHTRSSKPKQGFTGMATPEQFSLWNKISAGIEWLEEFQNQIRATPSTLKSPHSPELQISYQKHELGVDNGEPVITVYAEYRPTGPMQVEAIELRLVGKRESSLNWKVFKMSQDMWCTSDNKFKVPDGISPGEHDAKLAAFANGEWWGSDSFTITFPEASS